jgi:hypothetical protein
MNNSDKVKYMKNSIINACSTQSVADAFNDLRAVGEEADYLEECGAGGEAHIIRHQVAIGARELKSGLAAAKELLAEAEKIAGKKALEIANAPVKYVNS